MKRKKKSFTGVDIKKFKEKIILFSKENNNSIFLNSNNNPKSYDFIFAYGQKSQIVSSFNSLGQISPNVTTKIFESIGKTAIPEDVSGLTIEPINEQFVRLRFTQATALDVLHGGRVYIRHTNQIGGGATFQAAQDVVKMVEEKK